MMTHENEPHPQPGTLVTVEPDPQPMGWMTIAVAALFVLAGGVGVIIDVTLVVTGREIPPGMPGIAECAGAVGIGLGMVGLRRGIAKVLAK